MNSFDYTHSRIDSSSRQIRLIQIPPQTNSPPLSVQGSHLSPDCSASSRSIDRASNEGFPRFATTSTDDSPMDCTIEVVSLNNHPLYFALSYTWGDPNDLTSITLDGSVIQATRSLKEALRHLQHKERPVKIWVDAICINQMNDREKSLQIQLMKSIYQNADSVIIWLGLDSDGSDLLMDRLDELGEKACRAGALQLLSSGIPDGIEGDVD